MPSPCTGTGTMCAFVRPCVRVSCVNVNTTDATAGATALLLPAPVCVPAPPGVFLPKPTWKTHENVEMAFGFAAGMMVMAASQNTKGHDKNAENAKAASPRKHSQRRSSSGGSSSRARVSL